MGVNETVDAGRIKHPGEGPSAKRPSDANSTGRLTPSEYMKLVGHAAFWPPDPQFWGNLAAGRCVIGGFEGQWGLGLMTPRILGAIRVCFSSGKLYFYGS